MVEGKPNWPSLRSGRNQAIFDAFSEYGGFEAFVRLEREQHKRVISPKSLVAEKWGECAEECDED
jgi:hypothetical protein